MANDNNKHSFSTIMTVYEQAHELQENLPAFLIQEYEAGYEIIVVDETSTDETPDVLKLMKNQYPNLYTTYLPKPNRQALRRKLAINIGLKAAKNKWIIITKISTPPTTSDLLQAIADNLNDDTQITLGYFVKKGIRLQSFDTSEDARYHIRKTERRLRKMRNQKHTGYLWGWYDFIILRKEQVYDLLRYFEENISWWDLIGIRMHIFWKNLIQLSRTTLLITE